MGRAADKDQSKVAPTDAAPSSANVQDEAATQRLADEARQRAEAEAQQQAEAEAQRKAEAEATRRAEEETARLRAEEEARHVAEEEARRKAEEEARLRESVSRPVRVEVVVDNLGPNLLQKGTVTGDPQVVGLLNRPGGTKLVREVKE